MLSNLTRQAFRGLQRTNLVSKSFVQAERNVGRFGQNRFHSTEGIKPVDFESKYAEKLKLAAQKQGVTVEELKKKLKEEAAAKLKAAQPKKVEPKIAKDTAKKASASDIAKKSALPYDSSAPTLDKVVKMELLVNETPEKIAAIWSAGHANKDCITAAIPSEIYDKLYKRSQQYPMFIVPMPREEGVEFFFLQFNFHQCNFTSLLEYKTKGTEARPFLTLTHYTELEKTKGIVLMKGEINGDVKLIDTANAQFLAFALQQFYVTGDESKLKLVEKFHKSPSTFDYNEVIKAVESFI